MTDPMTAYRLAYLKGYLGAAAADTDAFESHRNLAKGGLELLAEVKRLQQHVDTLEDEIRWA